MTLSGLELVFVWKSSSIERERERERGDTKDINMEDSEISSKRVYCETIFGVQQHSDI